MKLIIVESPTKARTLGRFLGKEYLVEATMGHVKDLPKSKISVDIENGFEPDYQPVDAKKKQISLLKKQAKKADSIYLATDPDREGEAIAKHVEELFQEDEKISVTKDNIRRIVFHEITKSAVEEAISHPGKIDSHLVDAQIGRRVLDRLMGYKLSPILWKKVRRGLSAGRVQTVTVRLIVEREREIEKFKPIEYWEIFARVSKATKVSKVSQDAKTHSRDTRDTSISLDTFVVMLSKINDKKISIDNATLAGEVYSKLEKADYSIEAVTKREKKSSPYPPFTTSTLTQSGANLFGWSSKKTMSVAQKLYEEGHITYHRTDSFHIAEVALSDARKFIGKNYGDEYLPEKAKFYKTRSKSAQEAHEAIRPTDVKLKTEDLRLNDSFVRDGQKLYGLIWRRFLSCQMTDALYDSTKVEVLATSSEVDSKFIFEALGQTMKFDGWKKLFESKKDDIEFPAGLEKGDNLDLHSLTKEQKFTKPPARYNEASLIKTLEGLGIGRPSTYAPTISTIQTRQYVDKIDKRFHPTKIGFAVNDFLISNFDEVFDYSFTAGMEEKLDNVASGEVDWKKMMKDFYAPFEKKLTQVEKTAERVKIETESLGRKCPTCETEGRTGDKQGDLVIRTGRFGKFISCSLFPDCKHTEKYVQMIEMKCPKCPDEGRQGEDQGEVVVKKTRKGRTFYGCSRYPDCEFASWTNPNTDKVGKAVVTGEISKTKTK